MGELECYYGILGVWGCAMVRVDFLLIFRWGSLPCPQTWAGNRIRLSDLIACPSLMRCSEILRVHDLFLDTCRAGARRVAERYCTWCNCEVKLVPIEGFSILKPLLSCGRGGRERVVWGSRFMGRKGRFFRFKNP